MRYGPELSLDIGAFKLQHQLSGNALPVYIRSTSINRGQFTDSSLQTNLRHPERTFCLRVYCTYLLAYTVLPAHTPHLPLPRSSPEGATTEWTIIAPAAADEAYYSLIDPVRIKGWVGLVGWPTADLQLAMYGYARTLPNMQLRNSRCSEPLSSSSIVCGKPAEVSIEIF